MYTAKVPIAPSRTTDTDDRALLCNPFQNRDFCRDSEHVRLPSFGYNHVLASLLEWTVRILAAG
jgi:hypothetical protein